MPLPLIAQSLTYVSSESSKLMTLLQHLGQPYTPPILIFASTQARASSLAEELVLHDVPNVDCLHAGMTRKERDDAMKRMRDGESWVMITTEVMARGMDFRGIRGVINYDFPQSVQSYIHRIGELWSCLLPAIDPCRQDWPCRPKWRREHLFYGCRCPILEVVRAVTTRAQI